MWKITATGTETGAKYVYQVDAPDYAPKDAVWESACREHGKQKKAGKVSEFLDIRESAFTVELLAPQGSDPKRVTALIATAEKNGLSLKPEDIKVSDGELTIDGTPADQWVSDMTRS